MYMWNLWIPQYRFVSYCFFFIFRGFAFILFKESDAVDRVLEAGSHTIDNKTIDTKKAIPHDVHQVSLYCTWTVYVHFTVWE